MLLYTNSCSARHLQFSTGCTHNGTGTPSTRGQAVRMSHAPLPCSRCLVSLDPHCVLAHPNTCVRTSRAPFANTQSAARAAASRGWRGSHGRIFSARGMFAISPATAGGRVKPTPQRGIRRAGVAARFPPEMPGWVASAGAGCVQRFSKDCRCHLGM